MMSDALTADWPVTDADGVQFAQIGDQLVARKKTPAIVREVWNRTDEPRVASDLRLCGTGVPGGVHFTYPDVVDARTGIQFDYPEAGMWWSVPALAWICRPFIGDPVADPLVRVEDADTGHWLMVPESGLHLLQGSRAFTVPREVTESTPPNPIDQVRAEIVDGADFGSEENEPTDYDGYIDYLAGRSPGADGRTYVDGRTEQEPGDEPD